MSVGFDSIFPVNVSYFCRILWFQRYCLSPKLGNHDHGRGGHIVYRIMYIMLYVLSSDPSDMPRRRCKCDFNDIISLTVGIYVQVCAPTYATATFRKCVGRYRGLNVFDGNHHLYNIILIYVYYIYSYTLDFTSSLINLIYK